MVEFVSAAEIFAGGTNRMTRPLAWGPWELRRDTCELLHPWYALDLERCVSSAETLDWIAQIAGKNWGTPEVIGQLVCALDDLLHLQAHLCSCGQHLKWTRSEIRAQVAVAAVRLEKEGPRAVE